MTCKVEEMPAATAFKTLK